MKRFVVAVAFGVGALVLSGCNETSPSDGDVTSVDVPDIEIDIDGHTKTKTVQVPAPVKPAPVAPPAVRPPAPAKR